MAHMKCGLLRHCAAQWQSTGLPLLTSFMRDSTASCRKKNSAASLILTDGMDAPHSVPASKALKFYLRQNLTNEERPHEEY
jgi:hypothetical protein